MIKKLYKIISSSNWVYIIWPYLALLVFHLFFLNKAQQPWMLPDEFIQIGHARFFAGGDHFDFAGKAYANFAYGLIISPAFWFFDNPLYIYKFIGVTNVVLATALYFPIYYLLRSLFSLDKKISSIITIATCLYSAFAIQGIVAWQEAVIFTFHATSIALFLYFLKKQNYLSMILFSTSVGFLYMMHIRALPMLLVSVLFLIILGIYKKELRKKIILGIIFIILTFFITKLVNNYIILEVWQGDVTKYSIASMFSLLLDPAGLRIFIFHVLGQTLYLIQASYGLIFFAVLFLTKYLWQNKRKFINDEDIKIRFIFYAYIIVSSLAIFVASTLFTAIQGELHGRFRPDHLIYGRYNELFLSIFIALGLASFYKYKYKKQHYLIVIILMMLLAYFVDYNWSSFDARSLNTVNVLGVGIWYDLFINNSIVFITILPIFFTAIILKLLSKKYFYALFLIMFLFVSFSGIYYYFFKNHERDYVLKNGLLNNIQNLSVDKIAYDQAVYTCGDADLETVEFFTKINQYSYDWHLPDINFVAFDSNKDILPAEKYFLTSPCWKAPDNFDVSIIAKDRFGIQAIWKIN